MKQLLQDHIIRCFFYFVRSPVDEYSLYFLTLQILWGFSLSIITHKPHYEPTMGLFIDLSCARLVFSLITSQFWEPFIL